MLKIANVGDCGLRVVRRGIAVYHLFCIDVHGFLNSVSFICFPKSKSIFSLIGYTGQIIFSTSTQEHYFDCPYQLSSEMVGQTYLDAMVW